MDLFKKLQRIIFICTFTILNTSLHAHVLEQTNAQVILRDGQVEIKVIAENDRLIAALQNDLAWLMGEIDTVMPASLSVTQQQDFMTNALDQKTQLTVNKQLINFEQVKVINQDEHTLSFVFQARHQFADVTDISISFPKTLGSVHVSVIKPQYKLVNAGESAHVSFK
jgi:hypothetical protein